jgi:(2R)-3-sulfolactate dehydrogenase (NADP+)
MTNPVRPDELEALMVRGLERAGASASMAKATARALVVAEMEGLVSHGASRLPIYAGHVKNGRATGSAAPRVARDHRAACMVDAGGGLAFEACALAVKEGSRRAKEFGVAFVGIANSNHFGAAAYHVEPLADAGLVAFAFSNSPAALPAWGGKRAVFGTNPIAAAFPRRDALPLVIDLSLSEVARGKIMVAARDGKSIPLGWALDREGNPTTDAKAALEGVMLPAGGVKGAMLALAVEILVTGLTGSDLSMDTDGFFVEAGRPTRIGQALLVLDPQAFAGREVFLARIEALLAAMLAESGVRLPGDRRRDNRAKAERDGIVLPADLEGKIRALAGVSGG